MDRLTVPPGVRLPPEAASGPTALLIEYGTLSVWVDNLVLIGQGNEPAQIDAALSAGDRLAIVSGARYAVRNDGPTPAVAFVVAVVPVETPAPTLGAGVLALSHYRHPGAAEQVVQRGDGDRLLIHRGPLAVHSRRERLVGFYAAVQRPPSRSPPKARLDPRPHRWAAAVRIFRYLKGATDAPYSPSLCFRQSCLRRRIGHDGDGHRGAAGAATGAVTVRH